MVVEQLISQSKKRGVIYDDSDSISKSKFNFSQYSIKNIERELFAQNQNSTFSSMFSWTLPTMTHWRTCLTTFIHVCICTYVKVTFQNYILILFYPLLLKKWLIQKDSFAKKILFRFNIVLLQTKIAVKFFGQKYKGVDQAFVSDLCVTLKHEWQASEVHWLPTLKR